MLGGVVVVCVYVGDGGGLHLDSHPATDEPSSGLWALFLSNFISFFSSVLQSTDQCHVVTTEPNRTEVLKP